MRWSAAVVLFVRSRLRNMDTGVCSAPSLEIAIVWIDNPLKINSYF